MKVLVTWPATSPKTKAYEVSCRKRKKVEMLFAHLKRILKLGRLRLRGPNGAKDEFLLAAAAQNLRKPAKLRPVPAYGSTGMTQSTPTSRKPPTLSAQPG